MTDVVMMIDGQPDYSDPFQGDEMGITGEVNIVLYGPDGEIKQEETIHNLVTDAGDLYIAGLVAATGPTAAGSMKLGTGTTAVAKNGAGGSIVTYKTGSAQAFDATFPSTNNLGAGLGVQARFKVTWAAGVATDTALTECVISTGTVDSSAGTHYSRVVFTAINKGAADTLAITWNWKMLGS